MPELPDIEVYREALDARVRGKRLVAASIRTPFLLRTAMPLLADLEGRQAVDIRRLGKRIAFGFEDDYWLILHLMIAGRLHWADQPPKASRRTAAIFEFESGYLSLTEAGHKKRASIHLAQGETSLEEYDPKGLEVLDASLEEFSRRLTRENHTLKRALTDPRILSGIGNAYSDEILHRARLSPVTLTDRLDDVAIERLFDATVFTLRDWTQRLRAEAEDAFPEKVTAFHDGMAVHGRFGEPCPECQTQVQRIRYASNETNYCPRCQTGGKLLADRSLSRLLKKDWPRTIDELEHRRR